MSFSVIVAIVDDTTGKAVKQYKMTADKDTDNYRKFKCGERGAPVIASAYVAPELIGVTKEVKDKPAKKATAKAK